jgi:predicted CopG family antitoxin
MTKTISISDEAYELLASLKDDKMSFSDVVKEFARKSSRDNILKFFGVWADRDDEIRSVFQEIAMERKKARLRNHT